MNNNEETPVRIGPVTLPKFLTFPKDIWQWIWLAVRIAMFVALYYFFLQHPSWYSVTKKGVRHYMKKRMVFLAGICGAFTLVPCFRLKLPKWLRMVIAVVETLGLPFLAIIRAEMVHGYNLFDRGPQIVLFNYALALTLFLFFYIITNRRRISAVCTYCLIVFFSIVNYYVYKFRGEPLNAADLYVVGTALNVAGDYKISLTKRVFTAFFEMAAVVSVATWLPMEKFYFRKWKRLIFDAAAACLVIFTVQVFAVSDWPLEQGVEVKVFKPMKSYKNNGETLNFVRGFYYMIIKKPANYSASNAKKMMEASGYTSDTPELDENAVNPNIIFIMNESLADFSEYSIVETSKDPLAFYHALEDSGAPNVITGDLHTDVFGGRTANSEYEVLTGNSIAFLPYNAVPYALFVRNHTPSITWNMRDMGYVGDLAFHPYKANGYSRPRAYPNLGFVDFISIETIKENLTDADYVRNRVSDASDFRQIIEMYEATRESTDDPFYLFNVTMQNHGGFTTDFDNFQQDITLTGAFKDDKGAKRYLNLTEYTDEAFQMLTEYFSATEDPTILVMFGDHQPNLHNSFYPTLYGKKVGKLTDMEMFQRYETPLVIWANYDINPGGIHDDAFDEISINYLGAMVMELAGVPKTAYQKFLVDMQAKIPVFTAHGYLDTEGNFYETEDTSSPWYELVREYHMYEYNYQFDAGNRQDDFFLLDTENRSIDQ